MTLGTHERLLEVLLVEDNPADARLTQEILKESEFATNVTVAEDGDLAMALLSQASAQGDSSRPDLVLLDLNLPGKSGWDVLTEMDDDTSLSGIPVFILTGTEADQSMLRDYHIPPNCYAQKPIVAQHFDTVVRQLETFSREPLRT